jgi:hypothetical protein
MSQKLKYLLHPKVQGSPTRRESPNREVYRAMVEPWGSWTLVGRASASPNEGAKKILPMWQRFHLKKETDLIFHSAWSSIVGPTSRILRIYIWIARCQISILKGDIPKRVPISILLPCMSLIFWDDLTFQVRDNSIRKFLDRAIPKAASIPVDTSEWKLILRGCSLKQYS